MSSPSSSKESQREPPSSYVEREFARIEGDEYLSKLFKEFAEFQKWRELEVGTRTPRATSSPRPSPICQQGPLFNSEEAEQHFKFGTNEEQVYPDERGQAGMRTMDYSTMPIPQESVQEFGEEVRISFNKGSEMVACTARVGENLLRVAERCQVMTPNSDFCFEGSCCHCEMEVVGGAKEVGGCAATKVDELIRSCICPVPVASGTIQVNLVNEDDVWGEQVV